MFQSVKEPRLDRADSAAQCRGDSLQRIVDVKAEMEDFAVLGRQPGDAPSQAGRLVRGRGVLIRSGGIVRQLFESGFAGDEFVAAQEGEAQDALFAYGAPVAIEQNGAKPREEPALPIETVQPSPGRHESFLRQIFGLGAIPTESGRLTQEPSPMNTAKLAERFSIPLTRPLDQPGGVCRFQIQDG